MLDFHYFFQVIDIDLKFTPNDYVFIFKKHPEMVFSQIKFFAWKVDIFFELLFFQILLLIFWILFIFIINYCFL